MIKLTPCAGGIFYVDPFSILALKQINSVDGDYTLVYVHGADPHEPIEVTEAAEAIAAVIDGAEELRASDKGSRSAALFDKLADLVDKYIAHAEEHGFSAPPFAGPEMVGHPLDGEEPSLFPAGEGPRPDAPPPTEPPPLPEGAANSGGFPL